MEGNSRMLISRFAMEMAVSFSTLLTGAVVLVGAREYGTGWGDAGPEPGYFPFYVGLVIILASLGTLAQAWAKHRDRQQAFLTVEQGKRVLAFFGPMLAFVAAAAVLGLYVALVLYLAGVMIRQGGYRPHTAAAVGIGTAVVCYLIFELWFQVPLLKGPLEAILKIH